MLPAPRAEGRRVRPQRQRLPSNLMALVSIEG